LPVFLVMLDYGSKQDRRLWGKGESRFCAWIKKKKEKLTKIHVLLRKDAFRDMMEKKGGVQYFKE